MPEEKKPEVAPVEGEQTEVKTEELEKEIAALKVTNSGLVEEIKTDRTKRQDLVEEIKGLKEEPKTPVVETPETDVATQVNKVLAERDASRAKANKKAALEEFVAGNKEFHPENDPTGLKREALEKELGGFNLDGVVEVKDFVSVIGKAKALLSGIDTAAQTPPEKEIKNPYSSTPQTPITPEPVEDKNISPTEKKVMEQAGMTSEKFLELKEKMPAYINKLVRESGQ